MSIVIDLTPEVEARLRNRALQRGQDIQLIVAELIQIALEWAEDDLEGAIAAIQVGLDDFEAGRFQSFAAFAAEKRAMFGIPPLSP
jgi:predicted transcriptional regulator